MAIHQLLLLAACVSFGLSTAGVPARLNLTALGLLCWCLAVLV